MIIMKNSKLLKVLALAFAAIMPASAFASCNTFGSSTTAENCLTIKYYHGAYGDKWIENAAKDFVEAKVAEGVTITYKLLKDTDIDTTVVNELNSGSGLADIYMVRDTAWTDWVQKGWLEPLTDVYGAQVDTSEGKRTVKDYLSDGYDIQYYARRGNQGEYQPYALPWSASQIGLVYNEDILKSTGRETPPETVEELLAYCADLNKAGITPFTFPGKESHWFKYLIQVWWAQYQGVSEENTLNVKEGDGAFYDFWNLMSADVWKQEGIKAGIDTMQDIFVAEGGGWKNSLDTVESLTVAKAEEQFVKNKASAMLVGASFMYNEVKIFNKDDTVYKMMSLPTIENAAKNADGSTMKINYYTSEDRMIVPKAAVNKELAKEFLAFMCNEKYLLDFIKQTGTMRPFEYADSALDAKALELNEFNTSVLDVYKQTDAKIVSLPANVKTVEDRSLISLYEKVGINGGTPWNTFIDKIKANTSSETIMSDAYKNAIPDFDKWWLKYYGE